MYFCSECQEEHESYVYRTFRAESSTLWGYEIAKIENDNKDPKILITNGPYKKESDAEIAANAFLDGLKFYSEYERD
jgi:hypothetical protein